MAPKASMADAMMQDEASSSAPDVAALDTMTLLRDGGGGANSPHSSHLEQQLPPKPKHAPSFYRPDIDGLRTLAILPVLLFHAYPDRFPSGFIGVDVFFVISGYLISGILFKEMANGKFTYAAFYIRRVRRIFPTMLVVLAVTLWLGCLYLLTEKLKSLAATMLAGTLFSANLELVSLERGYWDDDIKENPLLHLWSLGVEEQFYFVWPFVAALVVRLDVRKALWTQGVLLAISFVFNLAFLGYHGSNKFSFYLPVTRFWQMGVGSLLAYLHYIKYTPLAVAPADNVHSRALSGGGIVLLVVAFASLDEASTFPGFWALFPTLGAALLIAAGPNTIFNATVLSAGPIVYIGKISYPLYLWHWPLLVFAKLRYPNADYRPFYMSPLAMLGLSFVLSGVTLTNVETPLRHSKSPRVVPALVGGMVIMCLVAAHVHSDPAGYSMTQQELNQMMASAQSSATLTTTPTTAVVLADVGGVAIPHSPSILIGPPPAPPTPSAGGSGIGPSPPVRSNPTTVPVAAPRNAPHLPSAETAAPPNDQSSPSSSPPPSRPTASEGSMPNSSRGPRVQAPSYFKVMAAITDWHPNDGLDDVPEDSPYGFTLLDTTDHTKRTKVLNPNGPTPLVVAIGDSHLDQTKPRFVQLFKNAGMDPTKFPIVVFKSDDGVPALACARAHALNMEMIHRLQPKVVLHVINWPQYLRPGNTDLTEPMHSTPPCCTRGYADNCAYQNDHDVVELIRVFQAQMTNLTQSGIRVFAATVNPEGAVFNPERMLNGQKVMNPNAMLSRTSFRQSMQPLIDRVEAAILAAGATLIDFSDNQCWNELCQVFTPLGDPVMKDTNHFRPGWVREYLSAVDQVVEAAMTTDNAS
ncbi:Aste57867_389 [Aphanomyces stellatus]|uniref:Aste57867_389 protein n=1 Tax=Aphanomyces stellatus TaxID=120398 RepID=A0A485K2W1_9STRA|nr:hypothetical protein As57867_000388 [Aphanomyces stellatus]VFT77614.1 Aste57867_389 [Aphanomyces stellatus]